MKNLKNMAMALVFMIGAVSFADAQMMRAGIHVTPALPMGDFSADADADNPDGMGANFGIGGNLFANYFFNENVHAGLEVGYQMFSWDADVAGTSVEGSYNIIPIQLTGAYHTDAESELDIYFGAGVGLFMVDMTFDDSDLEDLLGQDTESLIGVTPRIGISYELSDALRLDGNVAFGYLIGNQETTTETVGGVEVETTTGYADIMMLNINLGIAFLLFD